MNDFLITGGSGKLGTQLKKHLDGSYPTHEELDITTDIKTGGCNTLVHLAAYTNVDEAEKEPLVCFETNMLGTYNLLAHCIFNHFVFISTEHVHAEGVYFQSKLMGEMLVKTLAPSYLIIRTLFKPNPYPWDNAWINQYTQGDYVDIIAELVSKEIKEWDGVSKTVYVGTNRKTIYELALKTKPDVKPSLVEDVKGVKRPTDYL